MTSQPVRARGPQTPQTPKCVLSSHFLENEWLTEGGALCHLAAPTQGTGTLTADEVG